MTVNAACILSGGVFYFEPPCISAAGWRNPRFQELPLTALYYGGAETAGTSIWTDTTFYRGIANAGEDGTALLFASIAQLNILKVAKEVYFVATFKVVPTIYYQLPAEFTPSGDAAFPVYYAVMTRKTHTLYRKHFSVVIIYPLITLVLYFPVMFLWSFIFRSCILSLSPAVT